MSEHFQKNARPRGGGGGIRFSVRKCDNAKMLEWFPFPIDVKPLYVPYGCSLRSSLARQA
jgi:hypothetical protein